MKKLISWNVNGIRAITKKDFVNDVKKMNPDILCLQETKAQPDQVIEALKDLDGYHIYANSAVKKGYSSTAILSKEAPISVENDMGIEEHDQEGRIIAAEYTNFFIVTVYTPNSGSGLKRIDYRQQWDKDFLNYISSLNEKKSVIVCGDLNVAHQAIDLKNPKSNYNKTSGYTQKEIDGLTTIIEKGNFIDTFRHFYPDEIKYSWWSYRMGARTRNVGWRIDYFLANKNIIDKIVDSFILNDIMGSDHCPVGITLKD